MENNDSNTKPQQTGGLKLMTVFVVVLALHVVVIGGMTTYYLLKGGSDSELATDKAHKGLKANADGTLAVDGQMPDSTDKSSTASTPTTPATDASASTAPTTPTSAPTTDSTASTDTSSTPSTPVADTTAPTVAPSTPAASTPAPAVVTTSILNPGSEATPAQNGPVITPPATLAPPPDVDSAPVAGTPYVVKSHDSFAKIAHKNHVSVASLMTANNLTSNKLSIGQKLIIPTAPQTATTAPVTTPAPTPVTAPAAPAAATDVATTATPAAPEDPAPTPAKEKKSKAKVKSVASAKSSTNLTKGTLDHHLYTVVKGDTLTKIAHKFKTTPSALMTANNITDPTKLSIGKKLVIPSREAHTAKVSAPGTVQPAQVEPKAKTVPTQVANVTQ